MKADDLEKLRTPYPPEEQNREGRFGRSLGLSTPSVTELEDEIFSDLDPNRLGIGWWAPYPDDPRRILISDHLYLATSSIHTNLIEAKIHLLELEDAWKERNDLFADALGERGGTLFMRRPPVVSPADELSLKLADLHTAGFFRALGGALDCLGAAIIGVAALPVGMLKSDFNIARRKLPATTRTEGESLQSNLKKAVDTAIAELGPPGWLQWATDYRNMLVHRPRRAETYEFVPQTSPIRDYLERRIIRTETIPRLSKDPGRSEVESLFRESASTLVLSEHARDTLEGTFSTTSALLQQVALELLQIWRTRRGRPEILRQPKEQWSGEPSAETAGFEGYKPNSKPYSPGALIANPSFVKRLTAAALSDQQRGRWETFGK